VLVVQPWTLSVKDPGLYSSLPACLAKLKSKGVLVGYVSYADAVSEPFVRASDFAFFLMSSNLAQGAGISRQEAKRMCDNPIFLPLDYPAFVPFLDEQLMKRGIDHLLIVGGFTEDCVLAVAKFVCKFSKVQGLKIRLIEKLLVSQRNASNAPDMPKKLAAYSKCYSCSVAVSSKDPREIYLRYFK
jgi:hypothetical protein